MHDQPQHRSLCPKRRTAQVAECRPRLSGRLVLELVFGGVITGLLTLAGVVLIDTGPAIVQASAPSCTAFEVGGPSDASTRIQIHNAGAELVHVRLEFVDLDGDDAQTHGYGPILDPSQSHEIVF